VEKCVNSDIYNVSTTAASVVQFLSENFGFAAVDKLSPTNYVIDVSMSNVRTLLADQGIRLGSVYGSRGL